MEISRKLRKTMTYGALRGGMHLARNGSLATVESLRMTAIALTKIVIPLRMRLAKNMKMAGIYSHDLIDEHFERVVDQLMMLAHVFRAGFMASGCPERFKFDDSYKILKDAYAQGKGVINIAPHICGYPVYPALISRRFPTAIYLRHNKDRRKMWINEAIGSAGGGHLVYPHENASKTQRIMVALNILRQGKLLFITPDTPRKPKDGIAVTIFDKRVYFPTGVFVMSLRTGAPIVPVIWHWQNNAYHIQYTQPIELSRKNRTRGQVESATRNWAESVDCFLHEYPEMWWNWLDKRWTRILRS